MNALLFERPIWFGTGPLIVEEEAQEMEDFIYHRPVLVKEVIELLAPQPGALVVDATCGGGGHAEAILRAGADLLAIDQDPDAIEFAADRLFPFSGRVTLRQCNFRETTRDVFTYRSDDRTLLSLRGLCPRSPHDRGVGHRIRSMATHRAAPGTRRPFATAHVHQDHATRPLTLPRPFLLKLGTRFAFK